MLQLEIEYILKDHIQKHPGSCVASGFEMALKLEGAVDRTYNALQDAFPSGLDWTEFLRIYPRGFVNGITIERRLEAGRNGQEFDHHNFVRIMHEELSSGHYVMLMVYSGGPPGMENFHSHLVYSQDIERYYFVTTDENQRIKTGNWDFLSLDRYFQIPMYQKGTDVFTFHK